MAAPGYESIDAVSEEARVDIEVTEAVRAARTDPRSRDRPRVRSAPSRAPDSPRHSVILVREQEAQSSVGGGCGCLPGDVVSCVPEPAFRSRPAAAESMGQLHAALRNRYGGAVEIQVVDPRNVLGLSALLLRDFFRFRVGPVDALRTFGGLTVHALVVDGRIVARGKWPSADEVAGL